MGRSPSANPARAPEVLATPLAAYGPGSRELPLPREPFSFLRFRLLRFLRSSSARSCLTVLHHGCLLFSLPRRTGQDREERWPRRELSSAPPQLLLSSRTCPRCPHCPPFPNLPKQHSPSPTPKNPSQTIIFSPKRCPGALRSQSLQIGASWSIPSRSPGEPRCWLGCAPQRAPAGGQRGRCSP